MPASLIRSRALVTHAIDRHRWNEIADGALVQEDGIITEIGTYTELSRKHPNLPVIGSGGEILMPGFVNGHHHVGLTASRTTPAWRTFRPASDCSLGRVLREFSELNFQGGFPRIRDEAVFCASLVADPLREACPS